MVRFIHGIKVERLEREFKLTFAPDHFWFAYHPNGNVMDGATGDTAGEAVSKLFARNPELRRAA